MNFLHTNDLISSVHAFSMATSSSYIFFYNVKNSLKIFHKLRRYFYSNKRKLLIKNLLSSNEICNKDNIFHLPL
jgi:hypothetical protein